jgi:hypothetical protein
VGWVLAHGCLIAGVAVNLVLIFLPFYDANNMPSALSYASHLTNNSPAFSYNKWVAGPFIFALWVPMYAGYVLSGFNFYVSYTVLKLLFFAALLCLAYSLKNATRASLGPRSDYVFLFVLANPCWLLLNYVFVEFDILPVTILALAYVLLRYPSSEPLTDRRLIMVVSCLTISTFFYWFAAAALPTLLLYTNGRKQRLKLLGATVVMFGLMGAVLVDLMSGGPSIFINTFLGTNPSLNRASILGFQYFFALSASNYLILALLVVFVLPLALWKLRVGEAACLFVVITLLIYTSSLPLPDNYIAAFPFGVLAIATLPKAYRCSLRFWCASAFCLLGLALLFCITGDAQPDGTGIFYFGYNVFNANIVLFGTTASRLAFYRVYNVAVLLALGLSVAAVLPRPVDLHRTLWTPHPAPRDLVARRLPTFRSLKAWSTSRRGSAWLGVVAVLVFGSFAFNAVLPNAIQFEGSGTSPTYAVLPLFEPDNQNVVRPIPGATYLQSGANYTIFAPAPPMDFNRWFSGQGADIAVTSYVSGILPPSITVLNGTPFSVSLLNLSGPNSLAATPLTPSASSEVVTVSGPSYPVLGRIGNVSDLNGNATEWFNISTGSFVNRYYAYAFDIRNPGPIGTTLFHLQTANFSVALATYADNSILGFVGRATGNQFANHLIPITFASNEWNYIEFYPTLSGLEIDLSGYIVNLTEPFFIPNADNVVQFGIPYSGIGSSNFAFNGLLTSLYESATPFVLNPSYDEQVSWPGNVTYNPLHSTQIQLTVVGQKSSTSLVIGNVTYTADAPLTEFGIGKFQAGYYSVSLVISRLTIEQLSTNNYTLLPVYWATILPWIAVVLQLKSVLPKRIMSQPPGSDRRLPSPASTEADQTVNKMYPRWRSALR